MWPLAIRMRIASTVLQFDCLAVCFHQIKEINKRVLQMKPPDVLARLPRDLEKHFKNFKGACTIIYCSSVVCALCKGFNKT